MKLIPVILLALFGTLAMAEGKSLATAAIEHARSKPIETDDMTEADLRPELKADRGHGLPLAEALARAVDIGRPARH